MFHFWYILCWHLAFTCCICLYLINDWVDSFYYVYMYVAAFCFQYLLIFCVQAISLFQKWYKNYTIFSLHRIKRIFVYSHTISTKKWIKYSNCYQKICEDSKSSRHLENTKKYLIWFKRIFRQKTLPCG